MIINFSKKKEKERDLRSSRVSFLRVDAKLNNSRSRERKLARFHEHKGKQIDFQFGTETQSQPFELDYSYLAKFIHFYEYL